MSEEGRRISEGKGKGENHNDIQAVSMKGVLEVIASYGSIMGLFSALTYK